MSVAIQGRKEKDLVAEAAPGDRTKGKRFKVRVDDRRRSRSP